MKTKLATLILVATFLSAFVSVADEQRAPRTQTQTFKIKRLDGSMVELTHEIQAHSVKIKAHGETVAEFKVSTNNPVIIEGLMPMGFPFQGIKFVSPANGAITVRINCSGEFPFIFKADEVEIVDVRKSPLLAQ